tara:strand:- start:91 stop:717 length:627 start_codon:yes stop_codon:yes gene_type:complete
MLSSQSVSFSYDSMQKLSFPDIKLGDGESLLVLGESGVGKTTLIHILAGLLIPESGSVEMNGVKFQDLSLRELDQFRGNQIGMVFQRPYFVRSLSIFDNLALSLHLSKKKHDKDHIDRLLNQVGLNNKSHKKPDYLSQGEQQRAAIALAVVKNPGLILADEPTSSLDDKNCQKIVKTIKDQSSLVNSKLVIITHDQRLKNEFKKSITL